MTDMDKLKVHSDGVLAIRAHYLKAPDVGKFPYGSCQKSEALTHTPNNRAVLIRTLRNWTPNPRNKRNKRSHLGVSNKQGP